MFFNMKIEVNKDQPLDEVVNELERLGYKAGFTYTTYIYSIESYSDGVYDFYNFRQESDTTISELKEIKCSN